MRRSGRKSSESRLKRNGSKEKKPLTLRDKRSASESAYLQEEDTAWQT